MLCHLPLGEGFEGASPIRATKATLGNFVIRDCGLSPSKHLVRVGVIWVNCDHASIDSTKYEVTLQLLRCGVSAGTCMVSLVIVPILSLQPTTHQSGTYHKFHGRVFQLGYLPFVANTNSRRLSCCNYTWLITDGNANHPKRRRNRRDCGRFTRNVRDCGCPIRFTAVIAPTGAVPFVMTLQPSGS